MKNWYPETVAVGPEGTPGTYQFLKAKFHPEQHFAFAEFGIYRADTARNVCELFPNASIYLFDYSTAIEKAKENLAHFNNRVFYYENSQKYNDSYNWPLMQLIEKSNDQPMFDYCFLDGAHTVAIDALTYFLCDRLLRVGGYMDFDDYPWRMRGSSLDPSKVPEIAEQYTDEQIDAFQVKMIVDLLVRPDPRYAEVVPNKIFRKTA
jgi:hypothetical protein